MVDRFELERLARYIAGQEIENIQLQVSEVGARAALHGGVNGSRYPIAVAGAVIEGVKSMAEGIASAIAQAAGKDGYCFVDLFEEICREATPKLVGLYEKAEARARANKLKPGMYPQRSEIESKISDTIDGFALKLKLGVVAGGFSAKMGDTIQIAHSHGVAVNSNSAAIQVGRDNLNQTAGFDAAALLTAIRMFRDCLNQATELSADARTELDDAALALEREASDTSPDIGRLKRLAKGLAQRAEALALNVAGSALGAYLQGVLDLLPK